MRRRAAGLAAIVSAAMTGVVPAQLAAQEQAIDPATARHHQETHMESPKRRIPQLAVVEAEGVRYEALRGARARGFAQNGGIIAAIDVASGAELWTLAVYQTVYDPSEETDVQDRYITAIALSEDRRTLLVQAEGRQAYAVDLAGRSVTQLPEPEPERPGESTNPPGPKGGMRR